MTGDTQSGATFTSRMPDRRSRSGIARCSSAGGGRLRSPGRRSDTRGMPICASCGQDNPDIAKFCLACGAPPLAAAADDRERSSSRSSSPTSSARPRRPSNMDPEDVRARLAPYYVRLRTELERFGGTVEKFIGDAVVALLRRAGRARGRSGASRSRARSRSAARSTS